MVTTIDLRKELKPLYSPSAKEPELVRVPKFQYLMINGEGAPESQAFQQSVQALYSTAYTAKFIFKFEKKIEYPVMALEGLWWVKNGKPFTMGKREDWLWTLMILQPEVVTKTALTAATKKIREKKDVPLLERVYLKSFAERLCVQMMHVGPYSTEPETVQTMPRCIETHGLAPKGKHHEIYLSDPRRAKPEKMKTILRFAVAKTNQ